MMKKSIFIFVGLMMVTTMFVSCNKEKRNAKQLFSGRWIAKNPVKYSYGAGESSLGVGSDDIETEILEMEFKGDSDGLNGFWGGDSTGVVISNNYESDGTVTSSTRYFSLWRCKFNNPTPVTPSKSWELERMPQELKDSKTVLGELWSKDGLWRFYILSITNSKMKVAFLHISESFYNQASYYYSPVITFYKKKKK